MDESDRCYFNCEQTGPLIAGGRTRIIKIIDSSKDRRDLLYVPLEESLKDNHDLEIKFHNTCVSSYTSTEHVSRCSKRSGGQRSQSEPPPLKRRLQQPVFDFRCSCFICGDECKPKNLKNPSRWRRVVQWTTVELKEKLLKVCEARGDAHASEVRLRLLGALADLHAVDAQYHHDCFVNFISKRSVETASNKQSSQSVASEALHKVISAL